MVDGITKATFKEIYTVSANEALKPQLDSFVATEAFPFIKVEKMSGIYPTFTRRDFQVNEMALREPSAEYKKSRIKFGNNTFLTEDYGREADIDDREREILPVDIEQVYSDKFMLQGMLNLETKAAAKFLATGGTGATTVKTGGTADFDKWTAGAGDPIGVLVALKKVLKQTIGKNPDSLLITEDVFDVLLMHPDIIALLPDNQLRMVQKQIIATLVGIPNIYVMGAVQNLNNETSATQTNTEVATDKILMYYKGNSSSVASEGFGKIVYNDASQGVSKNGIGIYKYRNERIKSDTIRVEQFFTTILQSQDAAILLNDCI